MKTLRTTTQALVIAAVITVESAIRSWIEPAKKPRRKRGEIPWRSSPYGWRVLIFDTETTTDCAQRLLFGFFRIYENNRLVLEGIIAADILVNEQMIEVQEYATKHRLPVYSRERFVEEVFYPEVYERGTLCVGFNLPFDLTRIALRAGCGRGENRKKFRIVLSRRLRWHDLRIEAISGRGAFIGYVPKRKLANWEKPFFSGRFLDLSTCGKAFTGEGHSLKSAGKALGAYTRKMRIDEQNLGRIDRRSLTYGRQDVRATWALFLKLREEYAAHPFATFANESKKPSNTHYMGQIFSSASIAKAYLRLLDMRSIIDQKPRFNRKYLGYGAASYFGGRAEVRCRKLNVPVRILDCTSMYPTIFTLQNLQPLIGDGMRAIRVPVLEIRNLLASLTLPNLYERDFLPKLNCLVLIEPQGDIVPVRMRMVRSDPYTIAVTPLTSSEGRWYTLADVVASVLLSGKIPKIRRAIRFVPKGTTKLRTVRFRNEIPLSSHEPIFKAIVEQRQIAKAKRATKADPLELGLKLFSNSGAYGINAEVNVTPTNQQKPLLGTVYSDKVLKSRDVHDERPGAFANPIIASLVTGGARLLLAMLECEVRRRGGTFAFCDTDSLAIVCGSDCPGAVPCLPASAIDEIVAEFDRLNPYDPTFVKHLLKVEHAEYTDLRCFAISAKRYVLFRWRPGRRIQIVKASESGLGAILGRWPKETTPKLARRVWLSILMQHLDDLNPKQRRRAEPLIAFCVPLRRKFPISQPSILKRLEAYNTSRNYDLRVKPFGFVQAVTPALVGAQDDPLPIAPFETDLGKSRKLPWIDFHTGKPVQLDWSGSHFGGTLPVMRMNEYIDLYARHAEAKAADQDGNPAGEDTVGVLGRLGVCSGAPARIGKEVDRLDEDEGATLADQPPIEYANDELANDVAFLAQHPQESTARDIGLSQRRWRDIVKHRAKPHRRIALRIARVAAKYRLSSI